MQMNESTIHVAFASNRRYFHFVLIAVTSILHYHRSGNLVVHLLHPDLTDEELARFKFLEEKAPFELVPHRLDLEKYTRDFGRFSPILWRLAIPDLVLDIDRLIYLDCDLVLCDDIEKLWTIDLRGNIMGAIGDRVGRKVRTQGIAPLKYFNSGVMLWDLKRMRQENAMGKWQETLKQHDCNLPYCDQTLLNLVHRDECLLLPQNWNLHNSIYRNLPLEGMYTVEETIDAIRNPGIVHFTGHHKPWLLFKFTHHPYASRFWHFALRAPVSWRLKAKILLKRLLTGRLHEPKCQRPWGREDLKKEMELKGER